MQMRTRGPSKQISCEEEYASQIDRREVWSSISEAHANVFSQYRMIQLNASHLVKHVFTVHADHQYMVQNVDKIYTKSLYLAPPCNESGGYENK